MSNKWRVPSSLTKLLWRNFLLFFVLLLVVGISWWLGSFLGRYSLQDLTAKPSPPPVSKPEGQLDEGIETKTSLPFYLYVGGDACNEIAKKEFKFAVDAGISNIFIDVPFPWKGSDDLPDLFRLVQCVSEVAPKATYWLYLNLNPPEEWFQGKPAMKMIVNGTTQPFVCCNSHLWKKSLEEGFTLLVHGLQTSQVGKQIGGFVLGYLKNCLWIAPGIDESECFLSSFVKWIESHYPSPEEKILAFGKEIIEPAWVLENLHQTAPANVTFLSPKESAIITKYRRFFNESIADTIGFCAMTLRQLLGETNAKIYVPYGFNMETAEPETGQFSLGTLLDSDIDGFVFPITYIDRGIGESGGVSGTVDTPLLHGKEILFLDDTRTGVSMDMTTKEVVHVKGVRSENVYEVQKRNFGTALVHNAGLIWSDPEGRGWLLAPEQWDLFKKMMQVYLKQTTMVKNAKSELSLQQKTSQNIPGTNIQPKEETLPKLQVGSKFNTEELQTEFSLTFPLENVLWEPLAVIIDERANDILSPKGVEILSKSVAKMRDQFLKLGLPVEFYLMQDLLDERIPKKLIYFIFNLHDPDEKDIETLHRIFESDKAIVIWYYIPGWTNPEQIQEKADTLTAIHSVLCEPNTTAGSAMELDGRWLSKGETFGETEGVAPLLYIDDTEADVIARYQSNGKPSIALKTINEKWISVFYAEPALDYLVLREILSILEIPTAIAEGSSETPDTLLAGTNILIIHTKGIGDRILQFNQFLNIENLFQPEQRWIERESLLLSLGSGETIFLQLQPR